MGIIEDLKNRVIKFDENINVFIQQILWDNERDFLVIGIDEKYYRPAEVDLLLGDASKMKRKTGWSAKTKFKYLVQLMIKADYAKLKK
jgi:GDP-D-mannose dehydratase